MGEDAQRRRLRAQTTLVSAAVGLIVATTALALLFFARPLVSARWGRATTDWLGALLLAVQVASAAAGWWGATELGGETQVAATPAPAAPEPAPEPPVVEPEPQGRVDDPIAVMPLAERQKGVAMAIAMAKSGDSAPAPKVAVKAAPAKAAPVKASPAASAPAPTAAAVKSAPGGWRIQLGAFSNKAAAQSLYGKLSGKLGGAQAYYVPVGAMTRLQAGPFASSAAAKAACGRLAPQPCFPVAAK